jgi:uncharacterized Zn finger protein
MAFWDFPRYVPKAEKQAQAARKLEQLKKKRDVRPVIIQGSAIARTWWGKSWNKNLERYADYSNRIGRGRSYVRHGAVLDLQIAEREIRSLVQGSRAKPYEIIIKIKKLNRNIWQQIAAACSGRLESLQELLSGSFPKELGEVFMQQGSGLFPSPKEISFECSCPDWASMCKHVAASLYGVGARLDEDPSLFFTLRGVEVNDLIARTVSKKAERLLETASRKSSRIMENVDLSGMFGIELADGTASPVEGNGRQLSGRVKKKASAAETRKKPAGKAVGKAASGQGSDRKKAISLHTAAAKKQAKKSTGGRK